VEPTILEILFWSVPNETLCVHPYSSTPAPVAGSSKLNMSRSQILRNPSISIFMEKKLFINSKTLRYRWPLCSPCREASIPQAGGTLRILTTQSSNSCATLLQFLGAKTTLKLTKLDLNKHFNSYINPRQGQTM
jgi:hypothetical protein